MGKIRCTMTRTRQQRRFLFFPALQSAILPARPGDEAVCAQHFVPSSEEGGRIPLTHLKRASRATPQCRMVLPNGMPALSITGVFSRDTWQWAVGPQLKKAVILLLLLTGTVLLSDGDVFSRLALSEAAPLKIFTAQ